MVLHEVTNFLKCNFSFCQFIQKYFSVIFHSNHFQNKPIQSVIQRDASERAYNNIIISSNATDCLDAIWTAISSLNMFFILF